MRNLLAFLAALVLTVAGVGWYLDWYKLRSGTLPSGHHNINIDIDTGKFTEDLQKGEEKLHNLLEKRRQEQNAKREADAKADKDRASIPNGSNR
jgi:hypothetical protein